MLYYTPLLLLHYTIQVMGDVVEDVIGKQNSTTDQAIIYTIYYNFIYNILYIIYYNNIGKLSSSDEELRLVAGRALGEIVKKLVSRLGCFIILTY